MTMNVEHWIAIAGFVSQAIAITWWLAHQFASLKSRLSRIESRLGIDPPDDAAPLGQRAPASH